jgi:hypothetical protein
MRPSSVKDYQPVNQRESVEAEKQYETSTTPFRVEKPSYSHFERGSAWITWTRWVPWVLILCLIISNGYALVKLKSRAIPNAIFCKISLQFLRFIFTYNSQS